MNMKLGAISKGKSRGRPRKDQADAVFGPARLTAQNLLILASERERVRSDVQELFSSNPETSKHKWVREWIANLQEMDQHSQYSSSDCNAAQLPDAEGTDVGQERTTALEKHRDIVMTSVHSDMHPPSLHKLPDRRVMDDVCDEVQLREEQQLRALAQPIRKSQQRELFIIFDAAQRSVEARRRSELRGWCEQLEQYTVDAEVLMQEVHVADDKFQSLCEDAAGRPFWETMQLLPQYWWD